MSRTIRWPWQRPLPSNDASNILQLWTSGGRTREPILMKFGKQTQITTTMTVTDQILFFFKFKMADGRHVGKYWNRHNSPSNGPIWTKFGWSHPIMFKTCPPRCGCMNIKQLRASGGQTSEPILMKFDTPQQIKTSITVT